MFNVNLHANRYLDDVQPSISANPGVESDPDNPYYTLRYGDLAISTFWRPDPNCRRRITSPNVPACWSATWPTRPAAVVLC